MLSESISTGGVAAGFRLWSDELVAVRCADVIAAAERYRAQLSGLDHDTRAGVETEHTRFADSASAWLGRYNGNLGRRVRGYIALARECDFVYPWPVVAILGIRQVRSGLLRVHAFGLLGRALDRLGRRDIGRVADAVDDVLRRTNRTIFADSVPTVLYALRCRELLGGSDSQRALATAMIEGPLPPTMDEDSRHVIRELCGALEMAPGRARFDRLAALTQVHFGREQAIFTMQLGARSPSKPRSGSLGGGMRSVPAPVVTTVRGRRRLSFRRFELPRGFDIGDHDARVLHFRRAFVDSITSSPDDYAAACDYVEKQFAAS